MATCAIIALVPSKPKFPKLILVGPVSNSSIKSAIRHMQMAIDTYKTTARLRLQPYRTNFGRSLSVTIALSGANNLVDTMGIAPEC